MTRAAWEHGARVFCGSAEDRSNRVGGEHTLREVVEPELERWDETLNYRACASVVCEKFV